jgi:hypothetical protein
MTGSLGVLRRRARGRFGLWGRRLGQFLLK